MEPHEPTKASSGLKVRKKKKKKKKKEAVSRMRVKGSEDIKKKTIITKLKKKIDKGLQNSPKVLFRKK